MGTVRLEERNWEGQTETAERAGSDWSNEAG